MISTDGTAGSSQTRRGTPNVSGVVVEIVNNAVDDFGTESDFPRRIRFLVQSQISGLRSGFFSWVRDGECVVLSKRMDPS